jgi:hypothetical protein
MNCYCIIYEGLYCNSYAYITKSNIIELAKYLNDVTLRDRDKKVLSVYLLDSCYDTKFDGKPRCFFPTEYNEQYFLETYEARLLEKYRIDTLAV